MQKLKLNLENCYGIAKLNYVFDFSEGNVKIIYAPNGCMKTSLAKTFNALAHDKHPEDQIFIDRKSICEITKGGKKLVPKDILVVEPYSDTYSSKDRMATLLVNPTLKQRYSEILESIEYKKTELFKIIKKDSGSSNAEVEIKSIFGKKTIFECLDSLSEDVKKNTYWKPDFTYTDIINNKIQDFLKTHSKLIKDYLDKYAELIENSTIFKKGIFGTENALIINKSLGDNRFFEANHKLILENKVQINSSDELTKIIDDEKQKILKDEELIKKFEKIDTAITKNAELKTFKSILERDPTILTKMLDYEVFKKLLWVNYFSGERESYNLLLQEFHTAQKEINSIVEKANSEKTDWGRVIELFNNRFDVPFKLKVLNQDDGILKDKTSPNIGFTYEDGRGSTLIEENTIKKFLSTGEQRALYLLNIIFEIEARKKDGNECLLVLDDITDSFDYKNKYAIIEYIKDISELNLFKMIILTHNFDFYRTVASRLPIGYLNSFMTIKDDTEVKIVQGQYLKNVFDVWVKKLEKDPNIFVASIPFVRNMIEYINGGTDPNYLKLTNLLHIKSDTKTLLVNDLVTIYKTLWPAKIFSYPDITVYEMISEETSKIISNKSETIQLENKIILSMMIRLKAEEFMINKIANTSAIDAITSNQTRELLKLYKLKFPKKTDDIKLMEQVNLMTAENIHINAFMYEPILDLSDNYLIDLFNKIT